MPFNVNMSIMLCLKPEYIPYYVYYMSRCNSYERAKKKLTVSEAPNILTIALKRFQVIIQIHFYSVC